MPIPTYNTLMLPILRLCAEKVWAMRDLVNQVSEDLHLTDDERSELLPSGTATLISSRVHWAKTYLKQARLVDQPKRAMVTISQRGREVLASNPAHIDIALLRQFAEFREFQTRTRQDQPTLQTNGSEPLVPPHELSAKLETTTTPLDQIESSSREIEVTLRDALLARVQELPPAFFEKLIVDLLLAMGYGGSRKDAGERLGGTGDGGIDGVIREDQLGLGRIYLQAKRYQAGNNVGSEAVQAFLGALHVNRSNKGVMITTSGFTRAALAVAANAGSLRVILIDGEELTRLMFRHGVGVRITRTIEIKRIDLDYFEGEIPE